MYVLVEVLYDSVLYFNIFSAILCYSKVEKGID